MTTTTESSTGLGFHFGCLGSGRQRMVLVGKLTGTFAMLYAMEMEFVWPLPQTAAYSPSPSPDKQCKVLGYICAFARHVLFAQIALLFLLLPP